MVTTPKLLEKNVLKARLDVAGRIITEVAFTILTQQPMILKINCEAYVSHWTVIIKCAHVPIQHKTKRALLIQLGTKSLLPEQQKGNVCKAGLLIAQLELSHLDDKATNS